jgi:heterodisulfide reductase subunit A
MAAAAHHERITLFTCCDLESLQRRDGRQQAEVVQRPRYVDAQKCNGSRQCEYAFPVMVPDPEQGGFSATKAIAIPFSNAIPQIAVLDPHHCMLCGRCQRACPTDAVDYFQQPQTFSLSAGTAVVTTGFEMTAISDKPQYGRGRIANLIDALQMERLLAPHGPYNRVLRPSDGKAPDSIAYIQCAGSRDKSMGLAYCSRVCCMYAIKQAMLLSGALPLADITIYYMDIRAFGKGYEQFFQNAQAMGISFVKAKVAAVEAGPDSTVRLHYEAQDGEGATTADHDLAVLSLGLVPAWDPSGICPLTTGADRFIHTPRPKLGPVQTGLEGIFVAGAAAGPKDIVDTIAEAGNAAMAASQYLAARDRSAASRAAVA